MTCIIRAHTSKKTCTFIAHALMSNLYHIKSKGIKKTCTFIAHALISNLYYIKSKGTKSGYNTKHLVFSHLGSNSQRKV